MTRQYSTSPANTDGILLVDKPEDWTSHDVCHFVRKRF
ncbi:MAG: tRNA pseudouridine(55) synthase TruB, partial [Candidatus Omnitrophica bacterium]|nr:tRNA pseudouridine(55) synthase TruB [Candidatus Omnitrophota bacterium]